MKSCDHSPACSPGKTIPLLTKNYSPILGLVVLVLPKCPACIVAYSSAMTLCGTTSMVSYTTSQTDVKSYISLALGVLILLSILYSSRSAPRSVRPAAATALLGVLLLSLSIMQNDSLSYYYAGATLLVVSAVWFGGLSHWKNLLTKIQSSVLFINPFNQNQTL